MILHTQISGSGPSLALLHGFTTHGGAWQDIGARLQSRFRVLTIDLPGHGGSPAPAGDYDFAACADDVVAAMRRNDASGALLGYSMGGRVALAAALRAPQAIDRLILESASPGIEDSAAREARRAADAALAAEIDRGDWPAFIERWLAQPLFRGLRDLDAAARRHSRAVRLDNDPRAVAAALRRLGTGSQPAYWAQLADLGCRVLLVNGELDEKFDRIADSMQRLLRNARRCVVPAAGHTTHLDNPAYFATAVTDFLAADAQSDVTWRAAP